MSKMPRKSNDPLYRPGSALLEPTTPPVTPKLNKRNSTRKAVDRAAKNLEKQLKKKQAKKAAEKQAKKVSFEATQVSSPSPESSTSFTSSRTLSPQVVITKKASKKSTPSAPAKDVASRASKSGVNKSGVKKSVSKAKSDSVSPAARLKRQAAIEAEKRFGKTKLVG
jgi:hypothetical protein